MPMHDQVLAFFGFSRLPFGKHLKPADIFPSETHQEALSRLSFGVADEDLLLLTGPIGCGKSVALAAFVAALDTNRYTPLYVRGSGLSAAGLVKAVLEELKIDPPFFSGRASQLFFKIIPELNKKPVVIIDDAQDLAPTALTAIKSMVNFHFDSRTAITFVLAGQPELRELLKYATFAAVRQRIRISFHMLPMSLPESAPTSTTTPHAVGAPPRSSPMTPRPTSTATPAASRGSSTRSVIAPSCMPPPTTPGSSAPPTSLPMTSSTDLSPPPSPRSSRHPSVALPGHPHVARRGNATWRGLASLAGWKHHYANSARIRLAAGHKPLRWLAAPDRLAAGGRRPAGHRPPGAQGVRPRAGRGAGYGLRRAMV